VRYELRDYQNNGVAVAIKNLREYDNPFVLQAATGAGKSLMIADICHKLDEPVLVLQPSKELLEQNFEKLKSYGVEDIAMYSASMNQKEIGKYTYATIGSIHRKPELFSHFKYCIIDECHLVNPGKGMYIKFFKETGIKRVCGLTATPYRLQQKFFKDQGQLIYTSCLKMINRIHPFFFKKIAFKIETRELIEQGYLSPIKYIAEDLELDKLRLNSTGADYTPESMDSFWSDERLQKLAKVIRHIDKEHQRNLIFCNSIRAANRAKQILDLYDIDCAVVTGTTPKVERELLVQSFRDGKLQHLINVGVFTTGFDVPELDCITLARPTMSLALYYQMVGRGVRKDPNNPDKILTVYDLAGCVERLGRIETIRLGKEEGFKDMVESEVGKMTDMPLFTFQVKSAKFKFARKEI
jgi:DNA repair protein RadD